MSGKLRVLSIDDNHQNLNLIQQTLEDHFDVISSSGDESVDDLVLDCEPDIILLDIMLTDTNGYDICRSLRALPLTKKIIIIFVSSLNSLNDKLKAYESGGDDYICKPVNLAELEYKLEAYEKRINEQQQLETQIEETSEAAFASMKLSSELGLLIAFLNHSLTITTFDELYEAVKAVVANFQLKCSVEFRTTNSTRQYPVEKVSQLESEILELGKRAKRIVPFGKNVLFNSRQCSLLVKQLPTDEIQLGRVQDHLAILLEIINSRTQFIQNEESRVLARDKAVKALKAGIEENFSDVSTGLYHLEKKLDVAFDLLSSSLHDKLTNMGANQAQEEQFRAILDQTKEQFDKIVETSIDVDYKVRNIEHLLDDIQ